MTRSVPLAAVAAALAVAAPASAAPPRITGVLPVPADTDAVHVVVLTEGRPMTSMLVCDLDAVVCVKARRVYGLRSWMATLPPGAERLGAIGRQRSTYTFRAAPVVSGPRSAR